MRTKFKAWHKHLKQMYEVYAIFFDEGIVYCRSDEGTTHTFGYMDVEFLEYTGLKDRNGTEIYEGDILKTDLSRPYVIVVFRNGAFMYECQDSGKRYYDFMTPPDKELDQDNYLEIIGNIYTNPELLEVSE